MTRAEALAALIVVVECNGIPGGWECEVARISLKDVAAVTIDDSLDAVARLEAALLERGWRGPHLEAPCEVWPTWCAHWTVRGPDGLWRLSERAEAPSEARARLLAVLRALAAEEAAP